MRKILFSSLFLLICASSITASDWEKSLSFGISVPVTAQRLFWNEEIYGLKMSDSATGAGVDADIKFRSVNSLNKFAFMLGADLGYSTLNVSSSSLDTKGFNSLISIGFGGALYNTEKGKVIFSVITGLSIYNTKGDLTVSSS